MPTPSFSIIRSSSANIDDFSGLTYEAISLLFDNLIINHKYSIKFNILSPSDGFISIDKPIFEFDNYGSSQVVSILITKNYSIKMLLLEVYISDITDDTTISSTVIVKCAGYTPCAITPTPSITISPTRTATVTPSLSVTQTVTPTRTATPSITPTNSVTPTPTVTPTRTPTASSAAGFNIARDNGTSTFTGTGTFANKYSRTTGVYLDDTDGLLHYSWTYIGATGTCYVKFDYTDDDFTGNVAYILKNNVILSLDAMPEGLNISRNFSISSGDVIKIGAGQSASLTQWFQNVSIYVQ